MASTTVYCIFGPKNNNMWISEYIYNYFKWVSEKLAFEGSLLCSGRANSGEAEKRGANYV